MRLRITPDLSLCRVHELNPAAFDQLEAVGIPEVILRGPYYRRPVADLANAMQLPLGPLLDALSRPPIEHANVTMEALAGFEQDELRQEDFEALARYRYNIRRFLRFSETCARAGNLTPQQHQLLLAIKGYPGREFATVGELAERLQVSHHAAVELVNRAEKRGLVVRAHDDKDGRRVNVHLTAASEALLARLSAAHAEELRRMNEDLRPPVLSTPLLPI